MKRVEVTEDGEVRCPKCGAVNSYGHMRSRKAKLLLVPTLGLGVVAAPKRLRCNGCGASLKTANQGGPTASEKVSATHERMADVKDVRAEARELRKAGFKDEARELLLEALRNR